MCDSVDGLQRSAVGGYRRRYQSNRSTATSRRRTDNQRSRQRFVPRAHGTSTFIVTITRSADGAEKTAVQNVSLRYLRSIRATYVREELRRDGRQSECEPLVVVDVQRRKRERFAIGAQ